MLNEKFPKQTPLPWWEGRKGRGSKFLLSTPTFILPHRRGRSLNGENCRYIRITDHLRRRV